MEHLARLQDIGFLRPCVLHRPCSPVYLVEGTSACLWRFFVKVLIRGVSTVVLEYLVQILVRHLA